MAEFDWSKPVVVVNRWGEKLPAKVITTAANGEYPVLCMTEGCRDFWFFNIDGTCERNSRRGHYRIDYAPPPKLKKEVWLSIFQDGTVRIEKDGKHAYAEQIVSTNNPRIACIKKTFTYSEGQFDKEKA